MRQLSQPWSIKLSKSDVFIRYPLQYIQTFNAKPTEVVISTDSNMFGLSGCEDDPNLNPTCGWARDVSGDIIEDSQGFCCSCSTFGTDTIRGLGGQCSMFGDDAETAHCLNFQHNNLWYSAYELEESEIYFEILITVYKQNSDSTGISEEMIQETIILSPSNTGGASSDGKLVAKLIGDLVSYTNTLSLDNYYFFIPSSPNTNDRVRNWLPNSMLIEKNKVTLDGRECDKIGVSYHAFRYQTDKCIKEIGDRLNNQLEDYHDIGRYFAKDKVENVVMLQSQETNEIYFSFIEEIMQTSLVTLSISTDDIKFVINRADGHIEYCNINNFESLSWTHGLLECIIVNDGFVESMFRLSVVNCTNGISPIQNKLFTIDAGQQYNFTFNIYSENPLTSTHECNVILFDSLEAKVDEKLITFTSTQQNENRGAQEGNGQNTGSSATGTAVEYVCEDHCDSFYDITCFVVRGCWEAIGKLVIIAVMLFLFGPCLIRFIFKRVMSMRRQYQQEYEPVSPHRRRDNRKKRKMKHKKRHKKKKKHIELSEIEISDSEHEHKRKKRRKKRKHRKELDPELEIVCGYAAGSEGESHKKKKKRTKHSTRKSKLKNHKYLTQE
eukprot:259133_1